MDSLMSVKKGGLEGSRWSRGSGWQYESTCAHRVWIGMGGMSSALERDRVGEEYGRGHGDLTRERAWVQNQPFSRSQLRLVQVIF